MMSMFLDTSPTECKLARILSRAGGTLAPVAGSVGAMSLLKEE